MRTLVCLVSAFTIGAMLMEIVSLRETRDMELDRASEDAYWRGYNDQSQEAYWRGYLQAQDDARIEEDEPGWDCKTMGNKKCK